MLVAAANPIADDRLNDLLIDVGRSLLQYTSECWPWSAVGEDETQRRWTGWPPSSGTWWGLADLLAERGHAIDFGTYPTEYTSLHYVAVDYLLSQLVANQQSVLTECEAVAAGASGDDEAKSLLDDIVLSERKHLDELRALESRRQGHVGIVRERRFVVVF